MRSLVLLLALVLVAPAAVAQLGLENPLQPTPTTLYFHLDAYQDFPINTQPPDDRYARSDSLGLMAPTTSCVPNPTGMTGQLSKSFHTLYGFSTPGYVQYDFQEQGGPRIHPERGLAADVLLARDAPAILYWYLETDFLGGDSRFSALPSELLPTVVPEVIVQATIRTGDAVSIGASAYNSGQVIAAGQSDPLLLAPVPADHYLPQPDGTHVFEFQVPLGIEMDAIPQDEAYNVRIDVMMDVPGCNESGDENLMTSNVEVHTSPELRPRLEWSIMNPLWTEYIHPQFVGDQLVIHTAFNSPWGNYDVNENDGGITVHIDGPTEPRNLNRVAFTQRFHEHDHHFESVDVTYTWPFRADGAADGEYVITVTAQNDQQTAVTVGRASFEIGRNIAYDDKGNPVVSESNEESRGVGAPGLVAVVGLLGVALMAWRRRIQ